jgi:hypothetical protein
MVIGGSYLLFLSIVSIFFVTVFLFPRLLVVYLTLLRDSDYIAQSEMMISE